MIREAFAFNNPIIVSESNLNESKSFFSVDHESVILDAVKKAEDSGDIVVRLYESFGGRCNFKLKTTLPFKGVSVVNMIEEEVSPKDIGLNEVTWNNGEVALSIKPFQVITLKLHV